MKAELIGLVLAGIVGVATLVDSKLNSEPKHKIISTTDKDSTKIDSVKLALNKLKLKNDSIINNIKISNLRLKNNNKKLNNELEVKLQMIEKLRQFPEEEYFNSNSNK